MEETANIAWPTLQTESKTSLWRLSLTGRSRRALRLHVRSSRRLIPLNQSDLSHHDRPTAVPSSPLSRDVQHTHRLDRQLTSLCESIFHRIMCESAITRPRGESPKNTLGSVCESIKSAAANTWFLRWLSGILPVWNVKATPTRSLLHASRPRACSQRACSDPEPKRALWSQAVNTSDIRNVNMLPIQCNHGTHAPTPVIGRLGVSAVGANIGGGSQRGM